MPYLTINGIELKVTKATLSTERAGEDSRAISGQARSSERYRKRVWTLETGILEALEAGAVEGLVWGDGHHFPFDVDLYSTRGLGPSSGSTATVKTTGTPKFGAGWLHVSNGSPVTYPLQLPPTWTIVAWLWNGSAWIHNVRNSAGQGWVGGVRDDSPSGWGNWWTVNPSSGALTFTAPPGDLEIDDLAVLPYLTPTTWPPAWATLGAPFSDLRRVNVSGTIGSGVYRGEITNSESTNMIGSTGPTVGRRLELKLSEV